jgi:hypothetical protein
LRRLCKMAFKEKLQAGKFSKHPDIGEKIQFEIVKKFSGERRVYLGAELYEMASQIVKDGIHNLHPDLPEEGLNIKAREILTPWFKKKH